MPRGPGLPKTGGRLKGTPNKRTESFARKLEELNIDVLDEIAKALPDLSAEKRIQTLLTMLPYRYPKAQVEVEEQLTESIVSQMSDEELEAKTIELLKKYQKSGKI